MYAPKKIEKTSPALETPYHPTEKMNTYNNSSPNYANALKNIFRSPKKLPKTNRQLLHTMPKGWILLDKYGNIHDNRTQEEIYEDEHYIFTQKQEHYMNIYTTRFINNTIFDMSKNGYTCEEINAYLEELFHEEEHDYISDDENNDSHDNDYDSGYDSF